MAPRVNSCPQGGSEKRPCGFTAGAARTRCLARETGDERERTVRVFLPFQQFWVRVHTQLPLMKQQQQLQKRVVDTWGRDSEEAGGRAPRGCSWSCGPWTHMGSVQGSRGLCPPRAGMSSQPQPSRIRGHVGATASTKKSFLFGPRGLRAQEPACEETGGRETG